MDFNDLDRMRAFQGQTLLLAIRTIRQEESGQSRNWTTWQDLYPKQCAGRVGWDSLRTWRIPASTILLCSISEFRAHSVICTSPSKAFNTAGLQIANIITDNDERRQKIDKAININEVCDVNPFGVEALIAAYNKGEEWLDELNQYLFDNYNCLRAFFEKHLPDFPVIQLEGTYLVWVDCSALKHSSKEITDILLKKGKVRVNEGTLYGTEGEGFIRINTACPRQQLMIGLNRIKSVLTNL